MAAGMTAGNVQAAQDEAASRERARGGGVFQRKYGPLPGWGWALLAGGGALAYFWWRSRSKTQAASATGYTGTGSGDAIDSLQSEIDALYGPGATAPGHSGSTTSTTGTGGTLPAPTGLKATPTTRTCTIAWSPVKGAVSYNYIRSPGMKNPGTTPLTTHELVNLKPKTSYTWKVRGVNTAGPGAWASGSFKTK